MASSSRVSKIIPAPPDGVYTKAWLSDALHAVEKYGWIKNQRPGNDGGVGNTLEDLLGFTENNIPLADSGTFEIKAHRFRSSSLITLFHLDPLPKIGRSSAVEPILVAKYGWPHKKKKGQFSFRVTANSSDFMDRGFKIIVDRDARRVLFSFDSSRTDSRHSVWLDTIKVRVGNLMQFQPIPYWTFDDLHETCNGKIANVFFVTAETRREGREELLHYNKAILFQDFSFTKFIDAIDQGKIVVDFDASSAHNHGTKFRTHEENIAIPYGTRETIL